MGLQPTITPDARMSAHSRRRCRAGVTLIELLIVMGLLATVFGVGLGAFAALDVEQRQAAGVVKETLRAARGAALSFRTPARVRIDSGSGSLEASRLEVIGTWAFERGPVASQVAGAFGLDGLAEGGAWTSDGWIGDALSLAGDGRVEVPIRGHSEWDFRDGFSIRIAVRRDDTGGGHLLRIGRTLGLDVGARGELRAWIVPALDGSVARGGGTDAEATGSVHPNGGRAGGRVVLETEAGVVPPGQWVRLRFSYDRRAMELAADSIPRARRELEQPVWVLDGPLVLSDEERPFPGAVDALVISAMVVDEPRHLPDSVHFGAVPKEVRFGPDGSLERPFHTGPVELQLEFDEGGTEVITVGIYGTIE